MPQEFTITITLNNTCKAYLWCCSIPDTQNYRPVCLHDDGTRYGTPLWWYDTLLKVYIYYIGIWFCICHGDFIKCLRNILCYLVEAHHWWYIMVHGHGIIDTYHELYGICLIPILVMLWYMIGDDYTCLDTSWWCYGSWFDTYFGTWLRHISWWWCGILLEELLGDIGMWYGIGYGIWLRNISWWWYGTMLEALLCDLGMWYGIWLIYEMCMVDVPGMVHGWWLMYMVDML